MHTMAVVGRRRAVGAGANEWVSELRPPPDREQSGVHRSLGCGHIDLQELGGALEQDRVANRLGGRGQDEELGVRRQPVQAPSVAVFDLSGDRKVFGQPEPAGQLGDAPRPRELDEGERVAVAFGDDPPADRSINWTLQILEQQGERVAVAQSANREFGEPRQDLVADPCPGGAHDRHPLGEEPAGDEPEDLCRGLIKPLSVVDNADERFMVGNLGEKRQRRQPDQETVWGRAVAQPEHRRQRVALGLRQSLEVIKDGRTELMQPVVRQLHLRLDAHGPSETHPLSAVGDVGQ